MSNTTTQLFEKLALIITELRHPERGCPWDLEQTHESLKPFFVEEVYEALDAIDNNFEKFPEELGDVLLQILLHAQIGKDNGIFSLDDVLSAISEKLILRHPHVFGDANVSNSEEVIQNWEKIKQTEETVKKRKFILDSVPRSFPALLRAHQIGKKVSRVGFDWDSATGVKGKVQEEARELLVELQEDDPSSLRTAEELGDLLFTLAQLARKLGYNAEELLQQANQKFTGRFREMETSADALEKQLGELNSQELEQLWKDAKS